MMDKNKYAPQKQLLVSFLTQIVYYELCLIQIALCLIYQYSPNAQWILLGMMASLLLTCFLGGLFVLVKHTRIGVAVLPMKQGKQRALLILWMILAPLLGFALFCCSGGLFVVTTGA